MKTAALRPRPTPGAVRVKRSANRGVARYESRPVGNSMQPGQLPSNGSLNHRLTYAAFFDRFQYEESVNLKLGYHEECTMRVLLY